MQKRTDARNRLIKLIHVARRELGMADEDYRCMLASMPALGGRTSSADLSIEGLEIVLRALKAKGFKIRVQGPASKLADSTRRRASDPRSKKIRSLWLQLRDAGAIKNPSEAALAAYVKRLTQVEDLAWLSDAQATTVMEALKQWLKRYGGAK